MAAEKPNVLWHIIRSSTAGATWRRRTTRKKIKRTCWQATVQESVWVCVCVNVRARECVQFFISAAKRTVTVRGGKKRRKIKRLKAKR